MGVRGAVLGTLASFVMMMLFVIWRVQRVAPHDWEWPKIGILLGFGGAVVITHWILAPAGFFALAASATLATAIYVAGIWVFPVLEGYEKTRLRNAAGLLLKQGMGQASAL